MLGATNAGSLTENLEGAGCPMRDFGDAMRIYYIGSHSSIEIFTHERLDVHFGMCRW